MCVLSSRNCAHVSLSRVHSFFLTPWSCRNKWFRHNRPVNCSFSKLNTLHLPYSLLNAFPPNFNVPLSNMLVTLSIISSFAFLCVFQSVHFVLLFLRSYLAIKHFVFTSFTCRSFYLFIGFPSPSVIYVFPPQITLSSSFHVFNHFSTLSLPRLPVVTSSNFLLVFLPQLSSVFLHNFISHFTCSGLFKTLSLLHLLVDSSNS